MPVKPKPASKQSNPSKTRPINSKDSAANFPNRLTYPNGTYASTGAIGGTGGFGANLPTMKPGMDLQNPYNRYQPVQSSFISGSGQINYNTQSNPIRSQGPLVNSGFNPISAQSAYMQQFPSQGTVNRTQVPTGSFVSGGGQVNAQGAVSAPAAGIQQRPLSEVYDPNAADAQDWINYWNKMPVGTPKSNIYIPTKSEVWLMKGQARRRKNEERERDNNNYSGQQAPQKKVEPTQSFFTKTVGFRTGTG